MAGNKRERQEETSLESFTVVASEVMTELQTILRSVDESEITRLAKDIIRARNICCYGVGTEGLALKALSMNLHRLGFKSYYVGDTNAPPLSIGDVFLVSAGPSYYSTVLHFLFCCV